MHVKHDGKLIGWATFGIVAVIVLSIHFKRNFYVSDTVDQRDLQLPEIKVLPPSGDYNFEQLLEKISKLNAPVQPAAAQADTANATAKPDRFDSWHTEGHSVSLIAIYQHQELTALLSLKNKDNSKAELVRLQLGGQHLGLTVTDLTSRTATLDMNSQQRTLRLFTPGLELKQKKTPDIEK